MPRSLRTGDADPTVNVLISAAGRRGALVRLWQADLRSLDPDGRVVAVDASRLSAAARLADAAEVVPYTDDPAFLPALLDVCKRHDIGLIVPTHDGEGPAYVRHREAIEAAGIVLSLPGDEAIAVALDKLRTARLAARARRPDGRHRAAAGRARRSRRLAPPVGGEAGTWQLRRRRVPRPHRGRPAMAGP